VQQAVSRLQTVPGVAYAVPNYRAHIAGSFIPNDPGRSHRRAGWEKMQWNFLPGVGVDAPGAWSNLIADRRSGGRGVTIAVLDTGVAYRSWRNFARSPDFRRTRFVAPFDFVAGNRLPLDREGHGTFIAGEIAETTNNGYGLTGLAYGASIMPVRVLAADGTGDAATIAHGIRYAVNHHAQVINLSLEFELGITARDIPDIISAIEYAHRHGVVVVGAAGNDEAPRIAYPARAPGVIAVGATTRDRCLAWYSDAGHGLSLVAPGGDYDATLPSDASCHPDRNLPAIYQLTFVDASHPRRFGYPGGIYGTSMAAAEVAATAALVIASGVLGPHPSPSAILDRLEQTAEPLGDSRRPNADYGWGLLNAEAATAPGRLSAARGPG
jgi:serine protease